MRRIILINRPIRRAFDIFTNSRCDYQSVRWINSLSELSSFHALRTSMISLFTRELCDYVPSTRKKKSNYSDPVNIDQQYHNEVDKLYNQIQSAVAPLLIINKEYSIERKEDKKELIIHVGSKGKYRFLFDRERYQLSLHSPVSGIIHYYYDLEEKLWLGVLDRHDLRGLLTRDLIRHSMGVPAFD